jgi:hypothetical protein
LDSRPESPEIPIHQDPRRIFAQKVFFFQIFPIYQCPCLGSFSLGRIAPSTS